MPDTIGILKSLFKMQHPQKFYTLKISQYTEYPELIEPEHINAVSSPY